jgi:hypothetical protein
MHIMLVAVFFSSIIASSRGHRLVTSCSQDVQVQLHHCAATRLGVRRTFVVLYTAARETRRFGSPNHRLAPPRATRYGLPSVLEGRLQVLTGTAHLHPDLLGDRRHAAKPGSRNRHGGWGAARRQSTLGPAACVPAWTLGHGTGREPSLVDVGHLSRRACPASRRHARVDVYAHVRVPTHDRSV